MCANEGVFGLTNFVGGGKRSSLYGWKAHMGWQSSAKYMVSSEKHCFPWIFPVKLLGKWGSPWFLFCLFEKTVYRVMEGVMKKRKEEEDACQYVVCVCVCVEGKLEYFFCSWLGSSDIFIWKQIYFLFLGPAEFCWSDKKIVPLRVSKIGSFASGSTVWKKFIPKKELHSVM